MESSSAAILAAENGGAAHSADADVYLKLGKTKEAISQWQASLKDFQSPAGLDSEPEDVAKVTRKLDAARTRLSKETGK